MKSAGVSPKPKPRDDPEQSKRFEQTAQDLEIGNSQTLFNKALSIMKPKTKTPPPKKSAAGKTR